MPQPAKRRFFTALYWTLTLMLCCLLSLTATGLAQKATPASAGPGIAISRALARERAAELSDLRYALDLTLAPAARQAVGHEVLRFKLTKSGVQHDLALDFREGLIASAQVNGHAIADALPDGHLLLPAATLSAGENVVELAFSARVDTSGAAITRYQDKEDGSEYLYSLFVPMDASMAFPCFDQPDLKARFTLTITAPGGWTIVSNTAPLNVTANGTTSQTVFRETLPISTYLFAFAAGPWIKVHETAGLPSVYVRRSQVKRAEPEVPELQTITTRGTAWLSEFFQQPFPFPKYDMVLIPGFPFGGMEHVGATFLREDAILFRSAPTAADRFGRDITTLHELTHQWFGDLVTMRWFDDLWLKEGFAQYMAYKCLDALEPDSGAWKHFYEDIKPQAYGIDETEGTTPIFQDIPNLKDAKSAYGAIVYQKAPAILKQLEFRLGPDAFRKGLQLYLAQHAYNNAEWSDLIAALRQASGQDIRHWADAWVLRRGMPEVSPEWSCRKGRLTSLVLHQRDVLSDRFIWPMSNEVLLQQGSSQKTLRVDWNTASYQVPLTTDLACPNFVYANEGDQGYGRFLVDMRSEAYLQRVDRAHVGRASIAQVRDPFLRSELLGSLWENVRKAEAGPVAYAALALGDLEGEQDESISRILGGRLATSFHLYLPAVAASGLLSQSYNLMRDRMLHAASPGLRIVSFRTFVSLADDERALQDLNDLLAGRLSIPGLELRSLDRWNLVGKLISAASPLAPAAFAAERDRDRTDDGLKYAWAVQAGSPDAAVKRQYFAEYARPAKDAGAKPEDWITQSLRPFNAWNQGAITEPFLREALDQLPVIKRERKIFFLGAWLGAFLGGQTSASAEAIVKDWLAQPNVDADLRRKVLENADDLERTVRIRRRYPRG